MRIERTKNWPCRCFPVAYHHLANDIPVPYQRLVTLAYVAWLVGFGGFVWNACAVLGLMWVGEVSFASFVLALVVALVGVPFSWVGWYKGGVYVAAQHGGVKVHLRFFLCAGLHGTLCCKECSC